jgi:hypothetical protein
VLDGVLGGFGFAFGSDWTGAFKVVAHARRLALGRLRLYAVFRRRLVSG